MLTPAQLAARREVVGSSDIEPGLYPGVPFADYLRWPFLSQSILKQAQHSMASMRAAMLGERVKEVTDDMLLGSALHAAFLEPELMPEKVVKWDGGVRRGKAWDEFQAEHAGKTILTDTMHGKLTGMVRAMRQHPFVRRELLGKPSEVELSAVGVIEGEKVKGRADVMQDVLIDVKKVQSADAGMVTRTVLRFGYHIQAGVYRRLFNRDRFVLLVVEDSPPYDVVPYELSPAFIRAGEKEAVAAIQQYRFCVQSGQWPGRSDELVMLEVPEWVVNGEADFGLDDEED